MKTHIFITLILCGMLGYCGCSESPEIVALKTSLRSASDLIVGKQDESILILKENTTALAAIKSQVEDLQASTVETKEKIGTLEASLVKSEAQPSQEVIKSASATVPDNITNDSQPNAAIVVESGAARTASVRMKWNIEGNWKPTEAETAEHLRNDHGVDVTGLSHQQMHDLHAKIYDGQHVVASAVKSRPVQYVNRGSSCPGGVCPTNTRSVRRGLFGRRR